MLCLVLKQGHSYAADVGSSIFPDPAASNGEPMFMTIGAGQFDGNTALSAIVTDQPGNFTATIDDAQWCNNDSYYTYRAMDLPKASDGYTQPYFSTVFSIVDIDSSYNVRGLLDAVDSGISAKCNNRTLVLNFTLGPNQLNDGRYVTVFMAAIGSPNTNYASQPSASENTFRIILSGPGTPKAYPIPASLAQRLLPNNGVKQFFNLSNRNRPTNQTGDYYLDFTTPCTSIPEPLQLQFSDADNGPALFQDVNGIGHPALRYEMFYAPRTNPFVSASNGGPIPTTHAPLTANAIPTVNPGSINGGNHEYSDLYQTTLNPSEVYRYIISGLEYRNAISYSIDIKPETLFLPDHCPPTGGGGGSGPTCTIDSVVERFTGNPVINPGNQIKFNATVTNGAGYRFAVNGPTADPGHANDPNWGVKPNFLVSGSSYARGSPAGSPAGGMSIPTDAPYPITIDDVVMNSDADPGSPVAMTVGGVGPYDFSWGLLKPGAWAPNVTCTKPFNVISSSTPDSKPVLSFTEDCNNASGQYTITINSSDADGPSWDVSWDGTGLVPGYTTGIQTTNGAGIVLYRIGDRTVTLNAHTDGKRPASYTSPQHTDYSLTFQPCVYKYSVTPAAPKPVLDDDEAPTVVKSPLTYTSSYTLDPGVSGVRGIYSNKRVVVRKASGVVVAVYGSNDAISYGPNESVTTGPHTLPAGMVGGDRVCALHDIDHSNGWVDRTGLIITNPLYPIGAAATAEQCTTLYDRPYLRVYGSDVQAGTGIGASCTAPNADIKAAYRATPAGYVGSGAQYGVSASGGITGFVSMMLADAVGPSAVTSARTFSNVSPTTGTLGGQFGYTFCAADYWATKQAGLTEEIATDISGLTGQHLLAANSVITASSVISGHLNIYVDGDLTITGTGIRTNPGPWADVASIPSLQIVVKGNIYIRPTVIQLDGVYVAMPKLPSTPVDGRIITCTDLSSTILPDAALLNGACRAANLVINGSFIAQQVNFLRTKGTLRLGTAGELNNANIAEVFQYIPELMLNTSASKPIVERDAYDSIISLPPNL